MFQIIYSIAILVKWIDHHFVIFAFLIICQFFNHRINKNLRHEVIITILENSVIVQKKRNPICLSDQITLIISRKILKVFLSNSKKEEWKQEQNTINLKTTFTYHMYVVLKCCRVIDHLCNRENEIITQMSRSH